MSDFDLQGLVQVSVSTDIPAHKRIVDGAISEITTLRQQLEQAQAKVDLFRRACEDLLDDRPIEQAFILRKQAEAVEHCGNEFRHHGVLNYAQRLHQQADEGDNKHETD